MSTRKTINIGRVKGSMVYSGTDFQVENPLEGDLYLHNEEYAFYQYVTGNWEKVADLEEHSLETDGISIGTSDNYNINSDKEILTTKATFEIIKNSNVVDLGTTSYQQIMTDRKSGLFTCIINSLRYLIISTEEFKWLLYLENNNLKLIKMFWNGSSFQTDGGISNIATESYVDNKIPKKISDLENDSSYATEQYVSQLVENITTLDMQVVQTLPTENISTTTIYLVPISTTETNIYEEYIYVNEKWELIGTTKVDLSDYAKKTYVDESISNAITKVLNEEV